MNKQSALKTLVVFAIAASSLFVGHLASTQGKAPALKLGDPMPENLFVELAKTINPAVVNINTSVMPRGGRNYYRDPMLEMFERFYGIPMQEPQKQRQHSLGTGFIIREDGLIVTNNHVIQGADIISVQMDEDPSKAYDAKVIGRDQRTDIALIKIESTKPFPVAVLGSSKDVQVGEWVAAFGNPYGHGHTVTKGIISAKGRQIGELNKFPFLQTDASINPGNSGGPLVNSKGLVVGVNTAIDARAQGIGFAIPIDEVKTIITQLEKTGKVQRGYIGVALGMLDPRAARQLGINEENAVIITQVEKGGPAEKAGIEPYDIVREFNGKKVSTPADLQDAVGDAEVSKKAKIKIMRDGKERIFDILISERKEATPPPPERKQLQGQKAPFNLGFSIASVDKKTIQEWGLDPELLGRPMVIEVSPRSIASFAGLRPGDIILDVNRKKTENPKYAIKNLKKGMNTIRMLRGGMVGILIMDGN